MKPNGHGHVCYTARQHTSRVLFEKAGQTGLDLLSRMHVCFTAYNQSTLLLLVVAACGAYPHIHLSQLLYLPSTASFLRFLSVFRFFFRFFCRGKALMHVQMHKAAKWTWIAQYSKRSMCFFSRQGWSVVYSIFVCITVCSCFAREESKS